MKTYYAARDLSIQSRAIPAGAVVGTGHVERGEFTPADGLEGYVDIDHVEARLIDGRIVDKAPTQGTAPKAAPAKEKAAKPAKDEQPKA